MFQIRNIASRENMNIIFAVTKQVKATYIRLEKSISGSTGKTGELDQDSTNIISLVEQAYDVSKSPNI
jgi:Integrin beta chain VWA domain